MTPYRLVIFATGQRTIGRGKRQRTETIGCAFMGWTADQTAEPHRLTGSGTFLYHGGIKACVAARQYLAQPNVHQVSVRTNQDRVVFRYVKASDGRIEMYGGDES